MSTTRRSRKWWSDGMYFRGAWDLGGEREMIWKQQQTERKIPSSRVCARKNSYHSRVRAAREEVEDIGHFVDISLDPKQAL